MPPLADIEDEVREEWRRRSGEHALRAQLDDLRSHALGRGDGRAMRRRLSVVLLILAAAGIGTTVPALAHDRSASYSTWDVARDGALVTARLTALEASRLPWPATDVGRLGAYLSTHLRLVAGDAPCPVASTPRPLSAPAGELALEWRVACPPGAPLRIESDAFLDVAPSHLHFARAKLPDGRTAEHVLSDGERRFAARRAGCAVDPRRGAAGRGAHPVRLGPPGIHPRAAAPRRHARRHGPAW